MIEINTRNKTARPEKFRSLSPPKNILEQENTLL